MPAVLIVLVVYVVVFCVTDSRRLLHCGSLGPTEVFGSLFLAFLVLSARRGGSHSFLAVDGPTQVSARS